MNVNTSGGSGTAGDSGASPVALFPVLGRFAIDVCVTVELLPLELLDAFVAVVCVVNVDNIDGEDNRALAAASTAL
jgi:hypothetical protein